MRVGEHMHQRDGSRRERGGEEVDAVQEQLREEEGGAVRDSSGEESARVSEEFSKSVREVVERQTSRSFVSRGDVSV